MTLKQKIAIGTVALLTSFAVGRFSAPEKVKIETKTVEVEKKVEDTKVNKDTHKETTTTQIVKPDGTKETTTKTVEDTKAKTDTKEVQTDNKTSDTTKEVTRGSSKVTIAALAALKMNDLTAGPSFGASISKPILGPITVSVFGLSNLTFGAGIGLTF